MNLELAKLSNSALFRASIELQKEIFSTIMEDAECLYKEIDDKQLDENQLEAKKLLREIIDLKLFFKKFDEDELRKEETI